MIENWAQKIEVNSLIQNDSKNIAAASNRTWNLNSSGEYEKVNFGDGSNALKMAELKHDLNKVKYSFKTEGLNINFNSNDPLVIRLDGGNGPVDITLNPPSTFTDMQSIVTALQAEIDKLELPCRFAAKELTATAASFVSIQILALHWNFYPASNITDLSANNLQNGEYAISTETGSAAGTRGSSLRTVQEYLRLAGRHFDRGSALINAATPDNVNASIELGQRSRCYHQSGDI
jgi:flagellar hook-associated protein 1 FlgK